MTAPREQQRIQAKGFARPVRNDKLLDRRASQGKVIREERDGLRVFLDLRRQGRGSAFRALPTIVSQREG